MTVLRSGSASDVGRVRTINEDFSVETMTLFAVADGMGGHAGGEVASRIAIETLRQEFAANPSASGLIGAVRSANRTVWERSMDDPELRGMGTTLTAAALVATDDGDRLVLTNVGDSRTYRLQNGELTQLTRDHSVAEELVDRGELSEQEAAVHPHRHILTRALGVAPDIDIDVWQITPEAGQRFLLCSDGLTNEVVEDRIAAVLDAIAEPQTAAERLVRLANEHGGNDNITVVVLDVLVGEPVTVDGAAGTGDPSAEPGGSAWSGAAGSGAAVAGAAAAEASVVAATTGTTNSANNGNGNGAPIVVGASRRGPSTSAQGVEQLPRPPLPPPPGQTILSRAEVGPSRSAGRPGSRAGSVLARAGSRLVTLRVILFIVLLLAVLTGAWLAQQWYVNSSYFVRLDHKSGQVEVFQGRIGGFLGHQPKVVQKTGIASDAVPQDQRSQLEAGIEEPSLAAARRYVTNLRSEIAPPATTTTVPPATTTTVPPATTTTA
ncbi:MAG: Stp1/IreP family PP2C-type Ser/Thr phosphatase [Acidimicrobiales bacterium]